MSLRLSLTHERASERASDVQTLGLWNDLSSGVGTTGSAGSDDPPLFGARGQAGSEPPYSR